MNKLTTLLLLAMCCVAHAQTLVAHGVKNPLGNTYAEPSGVELSQQRLVLYRSPTAKQPGVVSLYLNGKYHTSLQHNAYTVVCLEPSPTHLRANLLVPIERQGYQEQETFLELAAKAGDSAYIRVSESLDGRPRFDVVSSRIAITELQTARQQMHTHSRLNNKRDCKETQTRSTAHGAITLHTDVWFVQRKTELKGITPQSRRELDALIQKLDTQYKQNAVVHVLLTGHADDTDDAYQNEQLAKTRAQIVSLYLLSNGLSAQNLFIEWSAALNQTHPQDGYHNRRAELAVFIHLD